MCSILEDPVNRVKLLKAGFSESEIAWLHVHVFENNVEILAVNWQPEE